MPTHTHTHTHTHTLSLSLSNVILGQAKMAVYISRKYKIAYGSSTNVELLFKGLIKARIKHYFIFYSHMKKLEKF